MWYAGANARWARAGGSVCHCCVSEAPCEQWTNSSHQRYGVLPVGSLRSLNEEQEVSISHIRVMAIRDARIRRRYDDVHDGASAGGFSSGEAVGSSCQRCEPLLSADISTGGEIEDREGWRSDRGRIV